MSDGPEVARKRGNARGAKGPCCTCSSEEREAGADDKTARRSAGPETEDLRQGEGGTASDTTRAFTAEKSVPPADYRPPNGLVLLASRSLYRLRFFFIRPPLLRGTEEVVTSRNEVTTTGGAPYFFLLLLSGFSLRKISAKYLPV